MRVGVAGLGRMGAAIAARLKEAGNAVVVWNRSPEKMKPLVAEGCVAATSPRDLVGRSDIIVTILTDATAIEQMFGGAEGLLAGDVSGKLFIEMSTVQPATQIQLAGLVRAKGAGFVECPVGGTIGPARQGKLIGMLGGEPGDIAKARPVIDQMCRRADHWGDVGAGSSMKLAINLPLAVYFEALGEAYAMVKHLGIDTARFIELLSDTSGGPNVLKGRGPVFAKALATGETGAPTFNVDGIRKDMRTMIAEAHDLGYSGLPVVESALAVFDQVAAKGMGDFDCAILPTYLPGQK